jgi:hypothetical protein
MSAIARPVEPGGRIRLVGPAEDQNSCDNRREDRDRLDGRAPAASTDEHKDFGHALLHVSKAVGRLATVINDAEHGGHEFDHPSVAPYVADLVVCALRMANTCPNGIIDLQRAVEDRISTKNDQLARVAPDMRKAEREA